MGEAAPSSGRHSGTVPDVIHVQRTAPPRECERCAEGVRQWRTSLLPPISSPRTRLRGTRKAPWELPITGTQVFLASWLLLPVCLPLPKTSPQLRCRMAAKSSGVTSYQLHDDSGRTWSPSQGFQPNPGADSHRPFLNQSLWPGRWNKRPAEPETCTGLPWKQMGSALREPHRPRVAREKVAPQRESGCLYQNREQ